MREVKAMKVLGIPIRLNPGIEGGWSVKSPIARPIVDLALYAQAKLNIPLVQVSY